MTPPDTTDADQDRPVFRLPARLDTLAALRLATELRAALAAAPVVTVDARDVEHVGLVALQLLRTLGPSIVLRQGDALDAARLDAGFVAGARPAGRPLRLRFRDTALLYGGEPLEALAALRAAGAGIEAVFPAEATGSTPDDPDRLAMSFRLTLPDAVSAEAVAAILHPFDDSVELDWTPDAAPPAAPDTAAPASPPAGSDMVAIAGGKLDQLAALVAELAAAHYSLREGLGAQATGCAGEIADMDRTMAALQDAVVGVAMSPIGQLVQARGYDLAVVGGATEIDRAVFDRIAPALAAISAASRDTGTAMTMTAAEDGSFVLLGIGPVPIAAADELRAVTRALGGRFDRRGDDDGFDLRLPRSLTLLDAIIVAVGTAAYAVPVHHMIEALRPRSGDLRRIGPDRPLLLFRDRYVPILALGERFGHDDWERDPCAAVLIVVHAGEHVVALMVDAISDQRQVTARPLGGGITPPSGIAAAATISGSRIAFTLDLLAFEPGPSA